jgi:hypothetical protein
MNRLEGNWRVERLSGALLPFGLSKRIRGDAGATHVGSLPVAWFRVEGSVLVYRGLPVRDLLARVDEDTFAGEGLLLGRRFCRFRLVRVTEPPTSRV